MVSKREKERLDVITKSKDYDGFLEEFQGESDRATAILGAAFVDEKLSQLIKGFLVDDEVEVRELLGTENPLGAFGARMRAAYCMGLISKKSFQDLKVVKAIRNKFAHHLHGLSFNDESIMTDCHKLALIQGISSSYTKSPRDKYIMTIVLLMLGLGAKIRSVEKKRCQVLPDFPVSDTEWV